ncbi:hypothetical protein ASPZODRAFT_119263 [Penicilliopsis zonata CBS 506.65]|uniref:Zn(2)-C6 fungal-type domain-containing protein n=1 Tax=Penicilliopsis zonata CBS 506.65 TaxID=1073090 RepID=A0A1L9SFR0_9EURO|nr:hypothetical protein ASPZODRAFT_119263 [Penicilliopsis zonata CBS 506.65]OJJ45937.1 hypothetical protein ASPZODRAFT_119263 [Penicilliopsis zonata CBS 506.65]
MMATRRTHQKSRHGCTSCKQRRVKCDEKRPVCTRCRQRQETCVFNTPAPLIFVPQSRPPSGPPSGPPSMRSSSTPPHSSLNGTLPSLNATTPTTSSTSAPTILHMDQLELEMQWLMHTHKLFARDEETRRIWEVLVLQEALRAPFLMHGVLALSALHLASQPGEKRRDKWLAMAISHKSTALALFTDQLAGLTAETTAEGPPEVQVNPEAMMSFAGIVVAFSFASAITAPADEGPSLSGLVDIFTLARGIGAIFVSKADQLRTGSFGPLYNIHTSSSAVPDHVRVAFDRLGQLNVCCNQQEPDLVSLYEKVITTLRDLASFAYLHPSSLTLVGGWAIRVPEGYFDELILHRPLALVVLAHYCVYLDLARDNWCIGPWGGIVITEISTLLTPEWLVYVQWARDQIYRISS